MALTAQQKADIRYYCGWSARFHQTDSRLEMAMSALATEPESEAQITGTLAAGGLLAQLKDIDDKIRAAHPRLKASEVGSIKLNPAEIPMLRSEGRRLVGRLCSIMNVERRNDVYGSGQGSFNGFGAGGGSGGNYVGK